MLASYRWLKELSNFEHSPEEIAHKLTDAGLEVEGMKRYGELPQVVIAVVRNKERHPKSDKLTLVTLFDGERELSVVCGAPNVPDPGKRVLLARIGAKLPSGLEIAERKVAGVLSQGMICSEVELDMGSESDGIVVVDDALEAAPGRAVSEVFNLEDTVFEIGLTPNRPDCLGHIGIARELSALCDTTLRLPPCEVPARVAHASAAPEGMRSVVLYAEAHGNGTLPSVPVRVTDSDRCPRYAAAVLDEVQIGPSPFWLRYRLHVLGVRSINNAVDVTNLVLLEYGYPTHAFDLERLQGGRIEVRTAREGEQILALDGVERPLSSDDLVICDAQRPVAIAGVMGGEHSSIHQGTRRIVVECAYFDPRSVRRTSRRLGLHTDASHRFERGVDPRAVPVVTARVVSLLAQLCAARAPVTAYEVLTQSFEPREIVLREQRAQDLLGVAPPPAKVRSVLCALGCEIADDRDRVLCVRVPTFRPDLTREVDLIEEVARVWGYANIPSKVPEVKASQGSSPATRFVRQLRERAAAVGLTEVINYAFVAPKQLERSRVSCAALRVANPLSEERSVMRTSLLPGLLANLQRAQRHQVSTTQIFELARTFAPSEQVLPVEAQKLGILIAGARAEFIGEGEALDFFDGKGLVESIVRPLTRGSVETIADAALSSEFGCFHPRRAARVRLFGEQVGTLGELHPDVLDAFELTGPVVYAELDVAALLAQSRGGDAPQVRLPPKFPASSRDLAIVVEERVEAGNVAQLLREVGGALVEDVLLFDLYRGGQLGENEKSMAFRIRYRDPEATLTDARVDEVHGRVTSAAEARFGARIRA